MFDHTQSYKSKILAHLKTGAKITPMEALKFWGCFSLSQRISELRQAGIPIQSKLIKNNNGKRHAIYWLDKSYIEWVKKQIA